jgi:hypothetical protein
MRARNFTQGIQIAGSEIASVGEQTSMQLAGERAVPARRETPDPRRVARDERFWQND